MTRFILLPATLLLIVSCGGTPNGVLIELPGAKEVQTHRVRGMDVLEYQLIVKYPAREQIAEVSNRLKTLGWKAVPYIYLYPKTQSSHVLGWTFFNDPPRQPVWVIYEWQGDWLDADGNLLTYTFRYKDPASKYQRSTFVLRPRDPLMSVTAIYTPAAIAQHKQRMMNPQK